MKKLAKLFFLAILFTSFGANAERLNIDITQGNFQPIPIAVHGFVPSDPSGSSADNTLSSVISNDLSSTGLFNLISKSAFLERLAPGQVEPTFASWSQIGSQALVTGSVRSNGAGYQIEFRLWDVLSGQQIAGMAYTTTEKGLRRVAHQIADQIYERLTGEKGYFDSRIVYVAESGAKNRRVKQLAIMDQDGANHQYITGGKSLVLTPRFTPSQQKIIYLSYSMGAPKVRTLEIETGREAIIGNFPGMTFAPRYSADGAKLLMSVAQNGNTDIYETSVGSGSSHKLTNDPSIDTTPSYSPDGSQIVFSSDRGGVEQLYIMNADGSGVKRISFGKGKYGTPVWSPRGDFIAFTKQSGGFSIGIIRPDGSGERLLTNSYMDEGPTWSPNGRVIMFARGDRSGRSRLFSVDITGYNERQIPTPGDASDPTWSPLLK